MLSTKIISNTYKNALKPVLFKIDPHIVHAQALSIGESLSKSTYLSALTKKAFVCKSEILSQTIAGINFSNPVGLAAGFDYDGNLAQFMSCLGFGFNTVGSVTYRQYEGNKYPQLYRLPQSRSLLVNKGFKSAGAENVAFRLNSMSLQSSVVGISVGSSNVPSINTISKAINDYVATFNVFKHKSCIKYFELNISCPNTAMTESFTDLNNLKSLLYEIMQLNIKKPIFVKMPNELEFSHTKEIMQLCTNMGVNKFILSNLVKNRDNTFLNQKEVAAISKLKGNFSGFPTKKGSDLLIKKSYKHFGKNIILVGCGGIFNAKDAYRKIKYGASLVQLITGMIYCGPQLASEISQELITLIHKDGYSNISEAIGSYHKSKNQ
ncbi:MAG: quinone-dependent dihydroorotate dehydrogenase [Patescibacteria group bacterium]